MPVALPPLVSLAVSLVPGLAKRVADRVLPGVEQKLSDTVSKVLGTDDVVVAEQKLQDPKIAGELRIRLAEIEVEADKVAAEAEAKRRSDELDRFRTEIADMQHARAACWTWSGPKARWPGGRSPYRSSWSSASSAR